MSTSVTTKPTTAAELIAMPDDGYVYELIAGRLRQMVPAGGEHGETEVRFGFHLYGFVAPRGLGEVYSGDTGFFFGHDPDTVLAPDVAFISAERLPPRSERRGYLDVIPDLVVEIVSPNDRQPEVDDKVARYLAAGVRLIWVAYPRRRQVVVHRSGAEAITLDEDETLDADPVLSGFRLPMADVLAGVSERGRQRATDGKLGARRE